MADIQAAMSELLITLVQDQRERLLRLEDELRQATLRLSVEQDDFSSVTAERDSLLDDREELRTQLDAMTAERDKLQRRWDAIPRPKPRPMTAEDEPSGDSEQLPEPPKNPGELPAEPWRAWKVGTMVVTAGRDACPIPSWATDEDKKRWYNLGYREQPSVSDSVSDSVGANGEGQS